MTIDEAIQLAVRHRRAGNPAAAEQICRAILAQYPQTAEAWHLLGVLAAQAGQREAALASYRQAVTIKPQWAAAHFDLGTTLAELNRPHEAAAALGQAVRLRPEHADAHANLAVVLIALGRIEEAVAACRQAIAIDPHNARAQNTLGSLLCAQDRYAEAVRAFQRAISSKPDYAEPYNNLGVALPEMGQLDEAIEACRRAVDLRPGYADALCNLGNALALTGQPEKAVAAYRQALASNPAFLLAWSNLLMRMHYLPGLDPQTIAAEHRRWNEQVARPLQTHLRPHPNNRDPERRLRIGYISPELTSHPVGRFLLPMLACRDRERFEIFCYSDWVRTDSMTSALQEQTDHWRNLVGVTDDHAAEMIRRDGIDILVDLSMHAARNRLLVFARKPAPVQATYLAYAGGTGLETMDYRLTDPYLDPPGNDCLYSEKSIRLPQTYWCYQPVFPEIPVSELPALQHGAVTFGCLNNFAKVTSVTLDAWCLLLKQVPTARLIVHALEGQHRQRVWGLLERAGIDPGRLSFVGKQPPADYFRQYHGIDIALDTVPYPGGTTTCDALWMGVPVVSLAGQLATSRGGLSVLSNVGLPQLVAYSADDYVRIAAELARDLPRLVELRRNLRERMEMSPLMDAKGFARGIEEAYRGMWRTWCKTDPPR